MNEKEQVVVAEQVSETTETVNKPREARSSNAPRGDRPNRGDRPARSGERRGGPRRPRVKEVKEYEERVVSINRVSKTVKGGRRMRFAAVVVIGNQKGKFGYANGKAQEVPDAIKKSLEHAKKDVRTVSLVKGDTIAHEVVGKFGAARVFLKPAPEGTGIIAGGPVRAVLELAGVRNVYSKVYGSRQPLNVIRATINGLENLKSHAQVKALRGK